MQPRLKKTSLDREDFANFRPYYNFNSISEVIERLVVARLGPHLTKSSNFNLVQSAYRSSHSTKVALLKSFKDVYRKVEANSSTIIITQDISVAFDTICHLKLLDRLQ